MGCRSIRYILSVVDHNAQYVGREETPARRPSRHGEPDRQAVHETHPPRRASAIPDTGHLWIRIKSPLRRSPRSDRVSIAPRPGHHPGPCRSWPWRHHGTGAVCLHRKQCPLPDRRSPPHARCRRPGRGRQRRQPPQGPAPERSPCDGRVRHRHGGPAQQAPQRVHRRSLRLRGHPLRQSPRGLPRFRRRSPTDPLEHPRPRRRGHRPGQLPRPSGASLPTSTPASGSSPTASTYPQRRDDPS